MFSSLKRNDEEAWEDFFNHAKIFRKEMCDSTIITVPVSASAATFKTQNYMRIFGTKSQSTKKRSTFERIKKKLSYKNTERKNIDQRIFWRCQNIYLCKGQFSFGVINAPCVISIGHSPIDIYITREVYPNYFLPMSTINFSKKELLPLKTFKINHPFILICKTISLFKVHLDDNNFKLDYEFLTMPSIQQAPKEEDSGISEIAPPTPQQDVYMPVTSPVTPANSHFPSIASLASTPMNSPKPWKDCISFRSISSVSYIPIYDQDYEEDFINYNHKNC
jgi:hypothetical protein